MEIFISGSMAYDRLMNFPGKFEDHILPEKIHILNVSFTVGGMNEKFGGTAGNIAYSLSLLNESPVILATVGRDFDRYRDWLVKNNLPLKGIKTTLDEFTASAYITTDSQGNQLTTFNIGAMKDTSAYKFENINPSGTVGIISPGNFEDMLSYSRYYKKSGIPYIFDPGQQIPMLSKDALSEMIDRADILISNNYELDMIKKATGFKKSDLPEKAKIVITTLGEKGVYVCSSGQEYTIPAARVDSVCDPTGAGDAFRAGLIKGMAMAKDIMVCAKMGLICAAYLVETNGTQEHSFTWDEFKTRYESGFGEEL